MEQQHNKQTHNKDATTTIHNKKDIYFDAQTHTFTYQTQIQGRATVNVVPARFSPVDKYGAYRRKAKEEQQ
ncbi:MAG: nucleolar RNA-binding Nop10p family protein [Candidatus Woesearchaeota archaeon]